MSAPVTTYQGMVYPWHCDHMGHMNVMWYAGKFDEATWCLLAQLGLTTSYFMNESRGMVAAEQRTMFKQELLAGTPVYAKSALSHVSDKSIKFFHELYNGENHQLASVTFLTGVHIDSRARRACSFPREIKERAAEFLAEKVPDV